MGFCWFTFIVDRILSPFIPRIAAKLKQSDLSEEMCITVDMLSKIERGVCTCTPDNMFYFCQKFQKSADYFYFGKNMHENVSDKKSSEVKMITWKKNTRNGLHSIPKKW